MDYLPKEIHLIILNYLDQPEFSNYTSLLILNENDYLSILREKYPQFYKEEIKEYSISKILLNLLTYKQNRNLRKYEGLSLDFVEYMSLNGWIDPNLDVIAKFDNLKLFYLKTNDLRVFIHFLCKNNSVKLLNYLFNTSKYDIQVLRNDLECCLLGSKYNSDVIDLVLNLAGYSDRDLLGFLLSSECHRSKTFDHILERMSINLDNTIVYNGLIDYMRYLPITKYFEKIWHKYKFQLTEKQKEDLLQYSESQADFYYLFKCV